jgi:hypothetical protein
MQKKCTQFFIALLLLCSAIPAVALEAKDLQNSGQKVVRYSPALTSKDLAKHHDNDMMEMSNGKLIKVGAIRKLQAAQQKMRSTTRIETPKAFLQKPAATGLQLKSQADLAKALTRPDNETVILPSGRRATVGQIKLVQPQVEKQTGRKLGLAAERPSLSGPAKRVTATTSKEEWKNILKSPDNTVIESPGGKKITVGELKQTIRERQQLRKNRKSTTPVQNKSEGGRQ